MDFSFRHVEIFQAIMTTGSTTAAAKMLRTSQPTISRELSSFEKLTLFKRVGTKLAPTEHGLMLFEEVRRNQIGLERIRNAAEAIRHFRHGQITLACLPAFSVALLPHACKLFRARFPGVSINITPLDQPLLQESLSTQRYHIGLTEDPTTPPGTLMTKLLELDLVCVLPTGHRLCQQRILEPQDFANEDFIYLAASDPYRILVDQLFRELNIERRMAIETHSAAAVCATVQQGVGVAIVNPLTALNFTAVGLQIRRFSHSIPFSVNLVLPQHRPESSAVEHFVGALKVCCDDIRDNLNRLI